MRRIALAVLLALATSTVGAQSPVPAAPTSVGAPHTGDAWIDARLIDVGRYAATYREAFVDELVRYQRAPRELAADLLARPGWTAGDAYFACALAVQLARPCRDVADARDANPKDDWAGVAERLGAASDAPAFTAIRTALVASYARWGRPLPHADAASKPTPTPVTTKPAAPAGAKPAEAVPGTAPPKPSATPAAARH